MRPGVAALVLAFAALAGCGGAAPPAQEPGSATPPPEDVEGLSRELEAEERDLVSALAPAVSATPDGAAASATPPPGNAAPPAPPAAESESQPATPCGTACRALASMRRSADRICGLTGAEAERCAWARQKVKDAEARVARAACGC